MEGAHCKWEEMKSPSSVQAPQPGFKPHDDRPIVRSIRSEKGKEERRKAGPRKGKGNKTGEEIEGLLEKPDGDGDRA